MFEDKDAKSARTEVRKDFCRRRHRAKRRERCVGYLSTAPYLRTYVSTLSIATVPFITWATCFTLDNPRPVPLYKISDCGGRFTVFKYALLRACRNPLSLILNAALPLVIIFMSGLWQGEGAMGYSFMGVALMYGSFVAARGFLSDKLDGTITRILASPITSMRYLVQNLLAAITPLTAQILAMGIIGAMLYGWKIGFTLSLMLIYFLFAAASVAFSFAWSCLFKEKETSYAMFSVLMSVVAMLGGFFIPLAILPEALRFIGALFPAFWVSNGILYLQGGDAVGTYWISIIVIMMFSLLYMVFGSKRRII